MLTQRSLLLATLAAAAASGCRTAPPATGPTPRSEPSGRAGPSGAAARGGGGTPGDSAGRMLGGAGGPGADPSPRPYDRVVTKEAKTREGVFKAHRIGSRLLFEIPRAELNRDFLLVTQIAKTTLGVGYGGEQIGDRVLRWERRDNRVLLRAVNYNVVADTALPIAQAVAASNYNPIVAALNVEAYGPDSAAVVDVTRLYTSGTAEFGVGSRIRGTVDPSRSFVERVASFPTNLEVEATHTYTPPPATGAMGGGGDLPFPIQLPPGQSSSVLMHWSMVRLPDRPMMPRLEDKRVGYFTVDQVDYGTSEQRAAQRSYINRYRLECAAPGAPAAPAPAPISRDSAARLPADSAARAIADSASPATAAPAVPAPRPPAVTPPEGGTCVPQKPIVYYVDPATPKWLVPWIKRGIEAWQPAFEAAGFREAIVARDAPTAAEDPDWSAEDARYSVIRWLPSTIENAQGPNVVDPRSGEILEADVRMYHNVMNLNRAWYFTQVGPLDPRARRLPLPDSLMGRLMEYVVAHEVGHTLGFPHNMKASATYDADSVRSRTFVARMGHTPTLMDYSRFNYVAQPEDSIPLAELVPKIGPYDRFATMWGYRPIPGVRTPEDERPTLDRWARMQDTAAYLRFSTSGADGSDPGEATEAVGDADAVKSTALGLKNLQRVVRMLETATEQPTENYDDLAEMYQRTLDQWVREMNHVANVVGGAESQEKYVGQAGPRFTPLPRARQQAAVRFLNEHAFKTPRYFLDPTILRKIEPEGSVERIGAAQRRVLTQLLDNARLSRLVEYEALAAAGATGASTVYRAGDMLAEVRRGVWGEIYGGGAVQVDAFRRRLQRGYIEAVDAKINPVVRQAQRITIPGRNPIVIEPPRQAPDARALLRGELVELDRDLRAAAARTSDRTTRLHLQDARVEIARVLDPANRARQQPASAGGTAGGVDEQR
jgi:hypothetical protein